MKATNKVRKFCEPLPKSVSDKLTNCLPGPFNMYFGCGGQLYYEIDGKLCVDRDPFRRRKKQ